VLPLPAHEGGERLQDAVGIVPGTVVPGPTRHGLQLGGVGRGEATPVEGLAAIADPHSQAQPRLTMANRDASMPLASQEATQEREHPLELRPPGLPGPAGNSLGASHGVR
jgi:hypothetical protein